MDQLKDIQAIIDECNGKNGCDSKCTKEEQQERWKLEAHRNEMHRYVAQLDRECGRRLTPYERTRNAVYATGNKWAIENFHATHD